jgi:hypothetical protein
MMPFLPRNRAGSASGQRSCLAWPGTRPLPGSRSEEELLALAEAHDPGFDWLWFAEALADISGRPDRVFLPYGLDPAQVTALKKHMTGWAARLKDTASPGGPET